MDLDILAQERTKEWKNLSSRNPDIATRVLKLVAFKDDIDPDTIRRQTLLIRILAMSTLDPEDKDFVESMLDPPYAIFPALERLGTLKDLKLRSMTNEALDLWESELLNLPVLTADVPPDPSKEEAPGLSLDLRFAKGMTILLSRSLEFMLHPGMTLDDDVHITDFSLTVLLLRCSGAFYGSETPEWMTVRNLLWTAHKYDMKNLESLLRQTLLPAMHRLSVYGDGTMRMRAIEYWEDWGNEIAQFIPSQIMEMGPDTRPHPRQRMAHTLNVIERLTRVTAETFEKMLEPGMTVEELGRFCSARRIASEVKRGNNTSIYDLLKARDELDWKLQKLMIKSSVASVTADPASLAKHLEICKENDILLQEKADLQKQLEDALASQKESFAAKDREITEINEVFNRVIDMQRKEIKTLRQATKTSGDPLQKRISELEALISAAARKEHANNSLLSEANVQHEKQRRELEKLNAKLLILIKKEEAISSQQSKDQAENAKLKRQMTKLHTTYSAIQHKAETQESQLSKANAEKEKLRGELSRLQTSISAAIHKEKTQTSLLSKVNAEVVKLQRELDTLKTTKKVDDLDLARYKQEAKEREMYKEAQEQMTSERDKEAQEHEKTRIALSDAQADVETLQAKLQNIEPENDKLRAENTRLLAESAEIGRLRAANTRLVSEENKEMVRLREENAKLSQELKEKTATAQIPVPQQTLLEDIPDKNSHIQENEDRSMLAADNAPRIATKQPKDHPDTSKLFTNKKPMKGPMQVPINREDDIQRTIYMGMRNLAAKQGAFTEKPPAEPFPKLQPTAAPVVPVAERLPYRIVEKKAKGGQKGKSDQK